MVQRLNMARPMEENPLAEQDRALDRRLLQAEREPSRVGQLRAEAEDAAERAVTELEAAAVGPQLVELHVPVDGYAPGRDQRLAFGIAEPGAAQ